MVLLRHKEYNQNMSYQFPPKLDELVKRQMAVGNFDSEDELLMVALRTLEEEQADWAAVEESLKTLDEGEQGLPLDEAFDAIRQRHNIPQDA